MKLETAQKAADLLNKIKYLEDKPGIILEKANCIGAIGAGIDKYLMALDSEQVIELSNIVRLWQDKAKKELEDLK